MTRVPYRKITHLSNYIWLALVIKSKVVQDQIKSCAGYMWWDTYGAGCPTLQWLASHILPQTTSAAAAESAWSEFDFVLNRRRNRMDKERASLLVYAHCNTCLLRRFKKVACALVSRLLQT